MNFTQLGPYRIGGLIGRGGMGEVHEGVHQQTGQRVAVKVLSPHMAHSEGFRERFEAEIDSLRQLRHPNIVELLGYGEHEGLLFYSMELIDGRSLEDELCSERRFSWREVTEIGIQLCKALKLAHDHGIIHRDLKPANILLTSDDDVKLLDFGIARLFGGNQMTNAGGVLGTADYMSPEQADGRPVTDRCDQYSLGCVLYALATGGPPFHSTSLPKLLQMQRFAKPEPVRRYAPDTPEELERIILQLLEKDPEKRCANVSVLQRQLTAMQRALTRPFEEDDFHLVQPEEGGASLLADDSLAATRVSDPEPPPPDVTRALPVTPGPETPAAEMDGGVAVAGASAATRFTSVQEERARERRRQRESWLSLAAPLAILFAAVALAAAGVWYLTRPASADALYAKIEAAATDEAPERLRDVEAEMESFAERFPNDSRAAEINRYREQLELQRAERRLRLVARGAGPDAKLAPLEQMYIEAVRQADANPERAVAQLSALVTLYGGEAELNESQRQALALARRQLARLQKKVDARAEEHRKMLAERLDRADELRADEPEQARQIWRAVIQLYADKPWAGEAVERARERLGKAESGGSRAEGQNR
jgi:serine/threonine-protein kinase